MSDLMTWAECIDFTFGEPGAMASEEANMRSRTLQTKKTVLLKEGVVELLLLERIPDDGTQIFAVSYPHKVGNVESPSQRMTQQFMQKLEALREFDRYVKFFGGKP